MSDVTLTAPATGVLRGIVVEGTDCSGKTRLIKHLKAHLAGGGWDVLQMGHRDGGQFKRYFTVYGAADRLLLDRAHISEVVYGEIWNRPDRFTPSERDVLDRIVEREFMTVLCTAPPELIWERYHMRGYVQPRTSFEDVSRAHRAFRAALGRTATYVFESHPVDLTCEPEVNRFFDQAALAVLDCLKADPRRPAASETSAPSRADAGGGTRR